MVKDVITAGGGRQCVAGKWLTVIGDEALVVKDMDESRETLGDTDDHGPRDSKVRHERIQPRVIG